MNRADAIEITTKAIWTVLVICGPAVAAAMIVGILVALFQALTQIQEVTLTFVPKILVVLLTIVFTAPFIGGQIAAYTQLVYSYIESSF